MSSHTESPTVRLAHDIAVQFRYLPTAEGAAAVANHIRLTWDPRMRRQLTEAVDQGSEHDPMVVEAVEQLRST